MVLSRITSWDCLCGIIADMVKDCRMRKMCGHLTKLKKLEKYQHWNIPYSWCLQNILKRLVRSFREMSTHQRGHPRFKKCKKHKGMTFSGEQVKIEKVLTQRKTQEITRRIVFASMGIGIVCLAS